MSNLNIEKFFKSFPTLAHKRNRFPWQKEINFNMKMGEITPIAAIRVVPGVTYNLDLATVIKVAPLTVPPMDNAIYKAFAFYGADRNAWENYPYWFGEKKSPENPANEPTYLVPKTDMGTNGCKYNGFYDNIGVTPGIGGFKIDAFLGRTDRMIYNTYFRNQALENPLTVNLGDSDDAVSQNDDLRKLCKPRDLFTQCLPTQNGTDIGVEIPLGSMAPVVGTGNALGLKIGAPYPDASTYHLNTLRNDGGGVALMGQQAAATTTGVGVSTDATKSNLVADLSNAIGAPLEGLYQAVAYNTMQYITSRGGNRYFERIANIYGCANPDGVLRLPEFLGSLEQDIDFDVVTQTSSTSGESTPLANRAANGYCENFGGIINKSFGEFGWIIIYGVVTYYPKYQQGVTRLMKTNDPLELFIPLFNLMGDEAIYEDEIFQQPDTVVNADGYPVNDEVWGYGKRNSRLLYPVNEIHGEQRSSYSSSLDSNHFAENFTSAPRLNKTFDKVSDTGFKRALTVTNETQFVCNALISGTMDVEIPLEAIPSIVPDLNLQI